MGTRYVWIALGVAALSPAASAADLTTMMPTRNVVVQGPLVSRAIVRVADQELGYSVLHDTGGVSSRGYRVHLTCTLDDSFVQTYCPTKQYFATCPRATVACR